MHLDCVFSILGDRVCLMMDEMMGEQSPTRRLVDEYVRLGPGTPYRLEKRDVEFSRYMRDLGWHIIPIKAADQLVCFPIYCVSPFIVYYCYTLIFCPHSTTIRFHRNTRATSSTWAMGAS